MKTVSYSDSHLELLLPFLVTCLPLSGSGHPATATGSTLSLHIWRCNPGISTVSMENPHFTNDYAPINYIVTRGGGGGEDATK